MPCCPNNISWIREQIITHTMGLMSTPNAGGMTALVGFRIGSVGHATRFWGALLRSNWNRKEGKRHEGEKRGTRGRRGVSNRKRST